MRERISNSSLACPANMEEDIEAWRRKCEEEQDMVERALQQAATRVANRQRKRRGLVATYVKGKEIFVSCRKR